MPPANSLAKLSNSVQLQALKPASTIPTISSVEDISKLPGVSRPQLIDRLVAGTVNQPISFNGAATSDPSDGAAFQLYNRAADKIEVATAINVGRSIDVTG